MLKQSPSQMSTLFLLLILSVIISNAYGGDAVIYPRTRSDVVVDTLHGRLIKDPYRWLENQESSETRAWIDRQNQFLESFYDQFPAMDKIRKQQEKIQRVDVVLIPYEAGDKYLYRARRGKDELYKIYMRDGLKGKEKLLIDPHPLSEDNTLSVSLVSLSPDGNTLAYGIRDGGEDELTMMFLDIASGKLLDSLPKLRYGGYNLSEDARRFYYSRLTPDGFRVYYHQLGSPHSEDKYLFGDDYKPEQYVSGDLSDDRRYLVITVYYGASGSKTEVWIKDLMADGPITPVVTDIDAQFFAELVDDKMYFATDWQAPNWRILSGDIGNNNPDEWVEVVPEGESVLESYSLIGGKLIVSYLENVVSKVKIFSPDGESLGEMELPTLGSVSRMYGQWNKPEVFYTFSSFTYPRTVFRYDMESGKSKEWSKPKSPIKSDNFEVNQVWYTSKDGTEIPMFVVHRKDLTKDGNNATILYGYGGFNNNETPFFSSLFGHWVDMGGVLAVANLRGGGEFGEKWHQAAMLEKKQNTFDDFIAAAEWLIGNNYTNPSKLGIGGWSNGGLLVGAVMNQRPELFKAVWCGHPLLDMVRYHKTMGGPWWVSEYGSADSVNHFDFIYDYSPYHNVKAGVEYPSVLYITGDGDTRVDPFHARKMTALLQTMTGSDNPVLLRYDIHTGHAYTSSVTQSVEENTILLGYMCWQLGLEP